MPEIRPIGWQWAARRGLDGPSPRESLLPREDCPICGAPGGNCVGGEHTVTTDPPIDDPLVVVEHDVFVEVPSPGSPHRTMTFRAFSAGHTYPRSKIEQMRATHGTRVLYHEVPTLAVEVK